LHYCFQLLWKWKPSQQQKCGLWLLL